MERDDTQSSRIPSDSPARDVSRASGDVNADPITNEPGAHPVGAGIGAGIGGVIGGVVGAVGGPAGVIAGAAVGGFAGGLVGKGAAEAVNPTTELEYWRGQFHLRPYGLGRRYEEFQPAYTAAIDTYNRNPGWTYDEAEGSLRRAWAERRGNSALEWRDVRGAAQDVWSRLSSRRTGSAGSAGHGTASPTGESAATEANHVVRQLHNSVSGYRSAVDRIDNPVHRTALRRLIEQREQFIAELSPLIAQRGQDPSESGSVMGVVQRSWMALTSALGGGDQAIANACERAEDSVVNAYRDALDSAHLTPPLREMLTAQYQHVLRAHDQVKAWRDQLEHQHR